MTVWGLCRRRPVGNSIRRRNSSRLMRFCHGWIMAGLAGSGRKAVRIGWRRIGAIGLIRATDGEGLEEDYPDGSSGVVPCVVEQVSCVSEHSCKASFCHSHFDEGYSDGRECLHGDAGIPLAQWQASWSGRCDGELSCVVCHEKFRDATFQ